MVGKSELSAYKGFGSWHDFCIKIWRRYRLEDKMNTLAALKEKVKHEKKHRVAAVANAADEQVLQAVKMAVEENLCGFLLFGNQREITSIAKKINLNISDPVIEIIRTETTQ